MTFEELKKEIRFLILEHGGHTSLYEVLGKLKTGKPPSLRKQTMAAYRGGSHFTVQASTRVARNQGGK